MLGSGRSRGLRRSDASGRSRRAEAGGASWARGSQARICHRAAARTGARRAKVVAPCRSGATMALEQRAPRQMRGAPARERGEASGHAPGTHPALLLADAERLEISIMLEECALPYALNMVDIGEGRAVRAGLSRHLAEQSHARHRRPRRAGRRADLGVRIRRHPAISRRARPAFFRRERARPRRGRRVAVLAGRRARADGGAGQPLPHLRAGEDPLRDPALHRRGQPAVRRDEPAPRTQRVSRRRSIRSPTWRASAGRRDGSAWARTSKRSRI